MKRLITFTIFLILLFLLVSCGPKWHLKRAQAHLRKAEVKGAQVRVDTVYKEITVISKEVKTDTVFQAKAGDTVRIEKEKLKIKYVRLPGDSVFIEGKCDPDTIRVKTIHTVTKEIKAPTDRVRWWQWLLIGIGAGVLVAAVLRMLR